MIDLLIIGSGGYGQSVAEAAVLSGRFRIVGFVDDRWPELRLGRDYPVLGKLADLPSLRSKADTAVVAIGNNAIRRGAAQQVLNAGFALGTVIHPSAIISPSAVIDAGATVMAGAIIGTESHIGTGAIVNAGAVVDHHARVGAFGQLAVGTCLGGAAVLGAGAWLQEGRTLGALQHIAEDTVIARVPVDNL